MDPIEMLFGKEAAQALRVQLIIDAVMNGEQPCDCSDCVALYPEAMHVLLAEQLGITIVVFDEVGGREPIIIDVEVTEVTKITYL